MNIKDVIKQLNREIDSVNQDIDLTLSDDAKKAKLQYQRDFLIGLKDQLKEIHESKVIAIYTGSKHYCISKDEIAYINFDASELVFVMMLKTSGLCKIVFDSLEMFKHHFEQVCEELNINSRYFKSSMFVRNGEL